MPTTISSLYLTLGVPTYVAGIDPITILPGAGYSVSSETALILNAGAPWYVVNLGTIASSGGGAPALGAQYSSDGVTIVNSGTIVGHTGVLIGGSAADLVVNTGFIGSVPSGNAGVVISGGTVVNSGTIFGHRFSVIADPGTFGVTVVADPGAVFQGVVYGGYGDYAAGAPAVLVFAPGGPGRVAAGTFAGLGSQYLGFSSAEVAAGASWVVTGSNDAYLGNSATAPGQGIEVRGTLDNTGMIATGTSVGGAANLTVDGRAALINEGYIGGSAATQPVYLTGGLVTNATGGTIDAGAGFGVVINGSGIVLDSGLIGGNDGIRIRPGQAHDVATVVIEQGGYLAAAVGVIAGSTGQDTSVASAIVVTVDAGGMISASQAGIHLSAGAAYVVNAGTITASGAVGVLVGSGAVTNEAGGLIAGGLGVEAPTVVNAGTIVGTAGYAGDSVSLQGSGEVLEVYPGAVFEGVVAGGYHGSAGVQAALVFAPGMGGGSAVGTFAGLGGYYRYFSSAEVAAGASWVATGTNYAYLSHGPTALGQGILVLGTLDNTGIIVTSTSVAGATNLTIDGPSGVLINNGTIGGSAARQPVYLTGGLVTNTAGGTIEGGAGVGVEMRGSVTLLDSGVVAGRDGIRIVPGQGYDVATVVIEQGGYLGGLFGVIAGDTGEYKPGPGTIIVTVDAGGTISASNTGILLDIGAGFDQVVNAGAITASGGLGVGVQVGTGAVTNQAGGLITGALGVEAPTIVNAGTIVGTAGDAVSLRASGGLLVVQPGAVFSGIALGPGAGGRLEFAAGTAGGVFHGLGSQYTGFGIVTIDAGANWIASGANTLPAGYTLSDAGTLILGNNFSGGGVVSLDAGGVLAMGAHATVTPTIDGLKQGTIELERDFATITGYGADQLTLSGGLVLNLYGGYTPASFQVTSTGGNTFITACFASGTGIATSRGRVLVEALREGERVLTAAGRLAAVRWIGHRRTDLRRHKRPHDVMPVRVTVGAFGRSLPSRDLFLSPDHAVFVDGNLVPVRHLINGVSIVQESREAVTYWHVELDRHDVILAEDLPCESFLDTGNRGAFENVAGAVAMTPDFARGVWAVGGCAPILTDPADGRLRAIHTRLLGAWHARRRDAKARAAG
jgi:hypothetical protein